jgi:hypothetical protein
MRAISVRFHAAFAPILLIAALLCTGASAQQAPPPKPRLGINLSGNSDYNPELPFVDLMRQSRPFGVEGVRDKAERRKGLELDEHGWVKRVEGGKRAETVLLTANYIPGKYILLYEGQGKIELQGKGATITQQSPGRMEVELPPGERGPLFLFIGDINPDDHVRNMRFVGAEFEQTYEENPFHPVFLQRWNGVACFRFMDWMETNGSPIVHWKERLTPESQTWSDEGGVPVEIMIDLCNRQKADGWFTMPHKADDDYVRQFATVVRDGLDPSLKVYVEYSNEVWNGQFAQARYAGQMAIEQGLDKMPGQGNPNQRYTTKRSLEIFKIWEDVFGGRERLVRVMPGQAGNANVNNAVLSFMDAYKQTDVLAVAPYMAFTLGAGKRPDADQLLAEGIDTHEELLNMFHETAYPDALQRFKSSKASADKFGVKLVAYEGGQHMVARSKSKTQDNVTKMTALMNKSNIDPKMGEIYRNYLDEWTKAGGDLFCHFSSITLWGNHGMWGVANRYDATPEQFPKYAAILEWAEKCGQKLTVPKVATHAAE